jgi:hypothetical protein
MEVKMREREREGSCRGPRQNVKGSRPENVCPKCGGFWFRGECYRCGAKVENGRVVVPELDEFEDRLRRVRDAEPESDDEDREALNDDRSGDDDEW